VEGALKLCLECLAIRRSGPPGTPVDRVQRQIPCLGAQPVASFVLDGLGAVLRGEEDAQEGTILEGLDEQSSLPVPAGRGAAAGRPVVLPTAMKESHGHLLEVCETVSCQPFVAENTSRANLSPYLSPKRPTRRAGRPRPRIGRSQPRGAAPVGARTAGV